MVTSATVSAFACTAAMVAAAAAKVAKAQRIILRVIPTSRLFLDAERVRPDPTPPGLPERPALAETD